jgi:hypothetical protein
MQSANDPLKNFVELIQTTNEEELDCEEVFRFLDEYSEVALRGNVPKDFLPLVQHHLEMCRDCCEEHEALLRVLEAQLSDMD